MSPSPLTPPAEGGGTSLGLEPWMTGTAAKLSTRTPPKDLASLSTINAATMRLCRADLPASWQPSAEDVLDRVSTTGL